MSSLPPSQPVFDPTSLAWSSVNPARRRKKETGNVRVLIPKRSIAARLAKLASSHI